MIILWKSVELMNSGIIKGTGQYITVEDAAGNKKQLEMPESIHTYAAWKSIGRQVKRGEKCKARFTIWKAGKGKTSGNDENDDTKPEKTRMFMKEAFFFTIDQTEPIKATA